MVVLATDLISAYLPPGPQGQSTTVESGSNANGFYIRLSDGTQMCWHSFSITPSASNTPTLGAWTFPIAFSATPYVQVSVNSTVPGTTVTGWSSSGATTTATNVYVTRANTTTTVMLVFAIGRWL
jgi:hypothetical protein